MGKHKNESYGYQGQIDKFKEKIQNKCKGVTKRVTRFRKAKKKAWNNYINSGKDSSLYEVYKEKLKILIKENKTAKRTLKKSWRIILRMTAKVFLLMLVVKGGQIIK